MSDDRAESDSSSFGPPEIRAALERVLASKGFRSSKRLKAFLTFIVERTLEGRQDEIKEYVIATEVYAKPAEYDPHVDSSVRVEASRLRTRLAEYYAGPGAEERLRIDLPRGGYVPVFERVVPDLAEAQEPASPLVRSGIPGRWLALAACLAVVLVGAVWMWIASVTDPATPTVFNPRPLTSDPGIERAGALSPDGNSVAFASSPDGGINRDIYVRQVTSDAALQLSSDPARESSPAWSPDGTTIAFLRAVSGRKSQLVVVSSLGGRERVVSDVEAPAEAGLSWTPDGKSVAVIERSGDGSQRQCRLRLIAAGGGEEASVPFSLEKFPKASHPAFSPDGSLLAFLAAERSWETSLYVASFEDGSIRRLAELGGNGAGVAWTADGNELIVGRYTPLQVQSLLRVRVDDAAVSEVTVGALPSEPTLSRVGSRLVYSEQSSRFDIARLPLEADGEEDDRFVASTRFDGNPQYSPDGKQVALSSARSGQIEIWVADADGSGAVQLTTIGQCGSPRWSPDGTRIAFDSGYEGDVEIYVVTVDSREVERVTKSPSEDAVPGWSPDGRWLYFASDRDGRPQIWRTAANAQERGEPTRLTEDGGFYPVASPDGKYLYFAKERADQTSLWRMALPDGQAEPVYEPVRSGWANWQVSEAGVYFVDWEPSTEPGEAPDWSLWLLDPESGSREKVRQLFPWTDGGKPTIGGAGLSIAPDRSWVLVGRTWLTSDLMVIDGFE